MTLEEIYSNLCTYDDRNPRGIKEGMDADDYAEAQAKAKVKCSCDNCFYGRTGLAEELLKCLEHDTSRVL